MNQISYVASRSTGYQFKQLISSLLQENRFLKEKLEQAYINTNFGCYNRAGAEVKGNEFLQKERRRAQSGELVMVCCDIKGMGKRNNEVGEEAVNEAIATCLQQIRQWRGIEFISQLNSGDEFVFIVDAVDSQGVVVRLDGVFKNAGFDGIYSAVIPIGECYISTANCAMNEVYRQKKTVAWVKRVNELKGEF